MIIMGYPCTGKSTWSRRYDSVTIDLESSLFHKDFETYVNVALDLERQGYNVFVSCHPKVRDLLIKAKREDEYLDVAYLYPDPSLKEVWIRRAETRYKENPTDKNERALIRIRDHFDEDIQDIVNSICDYKFTNLIIHTPVYRFYEIRTFPLKEQLQTRRYLKVDEVPNTFDEQPEQDN